MLLIANCCFTFIFLYIIYFFCLLHLPAYILKVLNLSQIKAMTNNAQTTAQLHSSHMLAKLYSKFFKPGFSNTWTVNLQMFKLDLEKVARNQRSNCQHPLDHQKSKRVPEKHLLLLYWLCESLWLCGSQQTVENSERDGSIRPLNLPPEKSVCRSRSNS